MCLNAVLDRLEEIAHNNGHGMISCRLWRKDECKMGKYFGTDGFRGEANVTLTSEHAYKIGKFIGWYYGARKDIRRAS